MIVMRSKNNYLSFQYWRPVETEWGEGHTFGGMSFIREFFS